MNRYKMLPSYHYVENEDGVINNPATDKLRTCTIYGNHGKNLIPYPFSNSTNTINGITFTDNGDGTITANGTATGNAEFIAIIGAVTPVIVKANTKYTLSGTPSDGLYSKWYMYIIGMTTAKADMGNGVTFIGDDTDKNVSLIIRVSQGAVADNVVFKPMLEEGETKTEFEPWCGVGDKTKNLIPYPYADTTKTINGVTFTDNGDGTITANGTATAHAHFELAISLSLDTTKKYTLSKTINNSNAIIISLALYNGNTWKKNIQLGESATRVTINFSNYSNIEFDRITLNLIVQKGITIDNVTIRPLLELGNAATDYEPYGYKIPVANDTRKNLLNVEDFTATQTGDYYAGISIQLTDSNMSTYLPYLDEMKGKTVQYSCDLDNKNFRKELIIHYDVEVDGTKKYISFDSTNNFTATLPDATPIRIEVRARSGSAEFIGTTVKFSNISLKLADIDPEITNLYIDNQIMEGESVSFKEDDLKTINLSKQNILSVESTVKPSSVSYTYYTY